MILCYFNWNIFFLLSSWIRHPNSYNDLKSFFPAYPWSSSYSAPYVYNFTQSSANSLHPLYVRWSFIFSSMLKVKVKLSLCLT